MRLAFLPLASLVALGVVSAELRPPAHCVPSNKTKSGFACSTPALGAGKSELTGPVAESTSGALDEITGPEFFEDTITWGALGTSGTTVGNPTPSVTSGTGFATVTASMTGSTSGFLRADQDVLWGGGFPSGMEVLYNFGAGEVTLTFSEPISAFGIYMDLGSVFDGGEYSATIIAYDDDDMEVGSVNKIASAASIETTIAFLGAEVTSTTALIYKLVLSMSVIVGGSEVIDFAIGTIYLDKLDACIAGSQPPSGKCLCDASLGFRPEVRDSFDQCVKRQCNVDKGFKNLPLNQDDECECDPTRGYKSESISETAQCQCDQTKYSYIAPNANGACVCSTQKGYAGQSFLTSNIAQANPTGCLFCKQLVKNPKFKQCKPRKCDRKLGYNTRISKNGECTCNTRRNFVATSSGQCVCKAGTVLNTRSFTCRAPKN